MKNISDLRADSGLSCYNMLIFDFRLLDFELAFQLRDYSGVLLVCQREKQKNGGILKTIEPSGGQCYPKAKTSQRHRSAVPGTSIPQIVSCNAGSSLKSSENSRKQSHVYNESDW